MKSLSSQTKLVPIETNPNTLTIIGNANIPLKNTEEYEDIKELISELRNKISPLIEELFQSINNELNTNICQDKDYPSNILNTLIPLYNSDQTNLPVQINLSEEEISRVLEEEFTKIRGDFKRNFRDKLRYIYNELCKQGASITEAYSRADKFYNAKNKKGERVEKTITDVDIKLLSEQIFQEVKLELFNDTNTTFEDSSLLEDGRIEK